MIRSVSFSVSKLDKRVQIRIRERVQIQSMTGFVSKWNSLMEWSALDCICLGEFNLEPDGSDWMTGHTLHSLYAIFLLSSFITLQERNISISPVWPSL